MTPYRATEPIDKAGLLALIRRSFASMEGCVDPPSSMHLLTEATIAEQAVSGEIWVIGHPALACVMLSPKPGELYLHKLAVDPGHQRRGLARALIAQAEACARAMGLPALTLMTRVELVENHAVFRSLGFVETGRTAHPGYDRPTTIRFAKPLI